MSNLRRVGLVTAWCVLFGAALMAQAPTNSELNEWNTARLKPDDPRTPTPVDGASTVAGPVTLTWAALGATAYDVRFGPSKSPPTVANNIRTASHSLPSVQPGTYYWRIIPKNTNGSITGPLWSFTVVDAPPPTCTGVAVPLGTTDLQAFVNARPAGTTFCFAAGIYALAGPVLSPSGNKYIGVAGAILDGRNAVTRGIWGYGGPDGQRDVTVQGLTFTDFTDAPVVMGWYWTVAHNEMRGSQIGVVVNSYSTLDGNFIHDNRQYGVTGGPGDEMLLVNNEIARNNTSHECGGACYGDAGGSKFVGTSQGGLHGLVWRNNNVHDNIGMAIWSDGNVYALYEGNTLTNNTGVGIFHEISWDAIIRNNTFVDNDSEAIGKSCWHGSNLHINTSGNVEIYGNTITANNGANGLCAVSSDRSAGDPPPFPQVVSNLHVHDNVITVAGTATAAGYVKDVVTGDLNNRFTANRYTVPNTAGVWYTWPTAYTATWAQWQGAGQDTTGTITGPATQREIPWLRIVLLVLLVVGLGLVVWWLKARRA